MQNKFNDTFFYNGGRLEIPYEMDYPNNPYINRLYDGRTHHIIAIRLVRVILPNSKDAYILMYFEGGRQMLTFVELRDDCLIKIPLDSYDSINIEELYSCGFDCTELLLKVPRHIFCEPIINYTEFLNRDEGKQTLLYATAALAQTLPPTIPPRVPIEPEKQTELEVEIERGRNILLSSDYAPKKTNIDMYVASENLCFLGDLEYNTIFFSDRCDVLYLPLDKNVPGHHGYNLLSKEDKRRLTSVYNINRINVKSIEVQIIDGEEFLAPNLYSLIFDKPVSLENVQLSPEEKEYLNKYYSKQYIIHQRDITVNNGDLPECINYNQVYYIRPDIAHKYNLEGLAVNLQCSDSNGNEIKGVYLDIPMNLLYSTEIIPDMNNNHRTYHASTLTVEGKKQQLIDVVRDQNEVRYASLSGAKLEDMNLLPYAKRYLVEEDGYEEPRWLLNISREMEFAYKLLSKNIYPIFNNSDQRIKVKELGESLNRPEDIPPSYR